MHAVVETRDAWPRRLYTHDPDLQRFRRRQQHICTKYIQRLQHIQHFCVLLVHTVVSCMSQLSFLVTTFLPRADILPGVRIEMAMSDREILQFAPLLLFPPTCSTMSVDELPSRVVLYFYVGKTNLL